MDTIVYKVSLEEISQNVIDEAREILKSGGLVAFPTETVYGLGGDALNNQASEKIYAAKGRPSDNPLIVHIAEVEAVYELAENVSDKARMLMEAFWPGPLTIIFDKKNVVPYETTGGLDTVAVRMPSHPVAMKLIKDSGVYIAAPSANTSGRPSPTVAEHVIEDLDGKIEMILDGGPVGIGIESTIVDVTGTVPTILRPGFITKHMLEDIVGEVAIDRALVEVDKNLKPKAPGMKYTHYAPKGELTIVESKDKKGVTEDVIARINELAKSKMNEGYKVGIISTTETHDRYNADYVINIGNRTNDITVSARLYGVLREFDSLAVEYIYSEGFENDDLGYAIMNRLLKAAGHRVVIV